MSGKLAADPDTVDQLREFFIDVWDERNRARGRDVQRGDLTGACVFATALARLLFGGDVRGGWHHVWLQVGDVRVCLTDGAGVTEQARERIALADQLGSTAGLTDSPFFQGADPDPYLHQPAFLCTRDFKDTWRSVQPQAREWARRFRRERCS